MRLLSVATIWTLTVWGTAPAAAQVAAVEYSSASSESRGANTWMAGWEFNTTAPVFVTHLAAVLEPSFGTPSASVEVGLWDATGALVLSATVDTNDPKIGHFHYHATAPVSLALGAHYTVAGLYGSTVDYQPVNRTNGPGVQYNGSRSALATSLTYPPSDLDGGFGGGKFGASFGVAAVPEPSTLALAGIAAGGLACFRRRQPT
jgi:hypothetical protein